MELLERYNELFETMSESLDPEKMRIFGEAERWAFAQLVSSNPRMAQQWLDRIESVRWNNYLTEEEASEIVSKMARQDGAVGAVWSYAQVADVVKAQNGRMECNPYYNGFALYVTMNMLISDHYESLTEFVSEEDIPKVVYKMAVEKLKDFDRREFIRPYFNV